MKGLFPLDNLYLLDSLWRPGILQFRLFNCNYSLRPSCWGLATGIWLLMNITVGFAFFGKICVKGVDKNFPIQGIFFWVSASVLLTSGLWPTKGASPILPGFREWCNSLLSGYKPWKIKGSNGNDFFSIQVYTLAKGLHTLMLLSTISTVKALRSWVRRLLLWRTTSSSALYHWSSLILASALYSILGPPWPLLMFK